MHVFLKVSFNLKALKIIIENFPSTLLAEPKTAFCSWINIGLLPTKGLTLPFISYGGTSIIIMMSLIAIVIRINNENKLI